MARSVGLWCWPGRAVIHGRGHTTPNTGNRPTKTGYAIDAGRSATRRPRTYPMTVRIHPITELPDTFRSGTVGGGRGYGQLQRASGNLVSTRYGPFGRCTTLLRAERSAFTTHGMILLQRERPNISGVRPTDTTVIRRSSRKDGKAKRPMT